MDDFELFNSNHISQTQVLRVDKNNAIHDPKDTDNRRAPSGGNTMNCNVKWARGTKEGKRDNQEK